MHVVGYSMGGLLATHLALREPERIASATLVAGALFRDSSEAAQMLKPYIDSLVAGRELTPFLRWIVPSLDEHSAQAFNTELMGYNDRGSLIASLKAIETLAVDWEGVGRLRVPMVAVVGLDDPVLEQSRRVVSRWPGSRLLEVPSGDHINITNLPEMLSAFRAASGGGAIGAGHASPADASLATRQ